jgi:hypothetical protein
MIIVLTQQERERFVLYLLQSAESDELMAEQATKLGPPCAPVAKMLRTRAMAAKIIAKDLQSVESMVIDSGSEATNHG